MMQLLADNAGRSFWMPQQASTVSGEVDNLFYFILWICVIFFLIIAVAMVAFVIKYRHRPGHERAESSVTHSTALELTWTVIPTILVLMIFYFGFRGYMDMTVAPRDSYEIGVLGQTWSWSFTYPNGYTHGKELHIPKGVPIRCVLTSQDVIHSLYLPHQRVKKDAVPGRYNRFWFTATEAGEFPIYCAEYCGTSHSEMLGKLIVHETVQDFNDWLEKSSDWEKAGIPPIEAGKKFWEGRCKQCHSDDGSAGTGPSFKDLWGREEEMTDGTKIVVDENYVHESILNPQARIVKGFGNVMPSFKGQLKDPRDINAIIAYLKSISTHTKKDALPVAGGATQPATQATQPAQ